MSNLDEVLKIEGFEPIYHCPDIRRDDVVAYQFPGGRPLKFSVTEVIPAKIVHHGEIAHTGWDIPTKWAIDENGQCWMDNAHGHPLIAVGFSALLSSAETETDRNDIRQKLGMKPGLPEWIIQARLNGWSPPNGFDFSKWE